MSDEKITALVKRLRTEGRVWRETVGEMPIFDEAAAALEASAQAPAVDREALIEWERKSFAASNGTQVWVEFQGGLGSITDDLIASGILQDADELRAEVLEDAATVVWSMSPQGPESEDARDVLLRLAQAIREGRA